MYPHSSPPILFISPSLALESYPWFSHSLSLAASNSNI
jgi:hypothetical protein